MSQKKVIPPFITARFLWGLTCLDFQWWTTKPQLRWMTIGTIIFEYSNSKLNFLLSCLCLFKNSCREQLREIYLHRHSQKVNLKFRNKDLHSNCYTFFFFFFKVRAKLGSADWQNFPVSFQRQVNKPVRDLIMIFTWNYFMSVRVVWC